MFEFDVKEIEKRLLEENPTCSLTFAKAILNFNPALHDVIEHWLKGEYLNFEYDGISLKEIVERTNCSFIEAVTNMKILMEEDADDRRWFKENMEQLYSYDFIGSPEDYPTQNRRNYKWL